MPARKTDAPGGVPFHLPFRILRGKLPQGEIGCIAFFRIFFNPGAFLQSFEIEVEARRPLDNVVFGVGLFTPRGIECWGTNTHLEGYASEGLGPRATARVVCPALRLAPGEYLLDVAVHSREGYPYDFVPVMASGLRTDNGPPSAAAKSSSSR